MKILKQNQYNQGIGKYKLLSSTSGVGSIITTKHGYYVLISDINKWRFILWANSKVELIRKINSDDNTVYKASGSEINNRGLNFIDDHRFVNFIKREKGLNNLVCLVGIPHLTLNEAFNTPNWKNHPIKVALEKTGENGNPSDFMIPGTHFPKWFKNDKGELKKLEEWKKNWEKEVRKQEGVLKLEHFAPPRDGNDFIKEIKSKNEDGTPIILREYKTLDQTNLILICANGHLSDVPWPKFIKWKTEKELRKRNEKDKGGCLFSMDDCCSNPKLKWTESKTKSEGYASIYIECLSCKLGSGIDKEHPKINLEGINGIQPLCPGEKPWEIELTQDNSTPNESCFINVDESGEREKMKITLVTANNAYYASGFSSLFIPMHYSENKSPELISAIEILNKKYQKFFDRTKTSKVDYWNNKFDFDTFLIENDIRVPDEKTFQDLFKKDFLGVNEESKIQDFHEHYRWQEYQCFTNNRTLPEEPKNNGFKFNDIELPKDLNKYFLKVQQVEDLKVTNVQLDFTRVKPKERVVIDGKPIVSTEGKNTFSIDPKEIFVLPANETLGEGLFFQFNDNRIENWMTENNTELKERFLQYLNKEPDLNSQGAGMKRKIYNNGVKYFLIHTFSHMLMRELEFSCGYPTASLKERLYISNNQSSKMSGVLIYTAEGSEGSMGGLVSQGNPEKVLEIITKGLNRTINCSSDPLCWESQGQGIFDLNLSACFSCSLVAETACEDLNLGLDRRVLVDEYFGYFRELLL
jgi:hypothetical protein